MRLEWATAKTKLSWVGEKRKRIARTDEDELVVPIPVVVRVAIIVRQRGTRILAGSNVFVGKDHTLFATKPGKVKFSIKRQAKFNGTTTRKKVANVIN